MSFVQKAHVLGVLIVASMAGDTESLRIKRMINNKPSLTISQTPIAKVPIKVDPQAEQGAYLKVTSGKKLKLRKFNDNVNPYAPRDATAGGAIDDVNDSSPDEMEAQDFSIPLQPRFNFATERKIDNRQKHRASVNVDVGKTKNGRSLIQSTSVPRFEPRPAQPARIINIGGSANSMVNQKLELRQAHLRGAAVLQAERYGQAHTFNRGEHARSNSQLPRMNMAQIAALGRQNPYGLPTLPQAYGTGLTSSRQELVGVANRSTVDHGSLHRSKSQLSSGIVGRSGGIRQSVKLAPLPRNANAKFEGLPEDVLEAVETVKAGLKAQIKIQNPYSDYAEVRLTPDYKSGESLPPRGSTNAPNQDREPMTGTTKVKPARAQMPPVQQARRKAPDNARKSVTKNFERSPSKKQKAISRKNRGIESRREEWPEPGTIGDDDNLNEGNGARFRSRNFTLPDGQVHTELGSSDHGSGSTQDHSASGQGR